MPPRLWHTVGTDLFLFDADEYLIIADYYSKYPFVRKIPRGQSNSKTVVNLTKQIFSEHGVPQIVRSDNGPHFQGHYPEFAKEYGFQHVTSSPHYPRSNGFVESQVKTVKLTLKKAKKSHTDPNMVLLCLRATPVDNKLASPAELLLGRPVQDNLPRKIPSSVNARKLFNDFRTNRQSRKLIMTNMLLPYLHWCPVNQSLYETTKPTLGSRQWSRRNWMSLAPML